MRVLENPSIFSSVVSEHLAIPAGMDPPEHTEFRRIVDKYYTPDRIREFEPACRQVAATLLNELSGKSRIEVTAELSDTFAIRIQSAFLDWPSSLHAPLLQWTRKNYAATLSGDRDALSAVAMEFDGYIRQLIADARKRAETAGADPMVRLLGERVHGRALTEDEIVSILRNWTVGELSTISACVGILLHYLAEHSALQRQLRESPALLPAAIDEILRIHPPFISSRRKTTEPVEIGGCKIPAGERVTILWASANRDENCFGDPDEFRLDRDPTRNLLYGAGIHVCPGAPLGRLELRVLIEEVFRRSRTIASIPGGDPVRAVYPGSGFSSLHLRIDWIL
jgi:cytochrome P450